MKVSDYVVDFLVRNQMNDIFLVSGGGIAHLLDSVGKNPAIKHYCNYHEQACAVAAEGYARISGNVGVCLVTLGPGAINALSGIMGAWVDSIPLLVLSGQVRSDLIADYTKLRQKGPQEANLVEMAKPVTKYLVSIRDPNCIRYELEKALHMATSGRPGPVWVELPFDVQGAEVDEDKLSGFKPECGQGLTGDQLEKAVGQAMQEIQLAERPLLIAGNGIRLAGCCDLFLQIVEQWRLPVALPFSAKDMLPEDHPSNMGIFGTCGQRRANFAVQNADVVLSLGAGLSVTKVGFNYQNFAPKARKIIVDIDSNQIEHQVLEAETGIVADLRVFLPEMLNQAQCNTYCPQSRWLEACSNWKQQYPLVSADSINSNGNVDIYVFMDILSDILDCGDVLVTGNGSDAVSCWQAFQNKKDQRIIISGNWGSMGWDLPIAIGSCVANGKKPTVVVCGDGSIQWNSQEFLTIKNHALPLKIFVFNNSGYASIRATQKSLFDGRLVGADTTSGVACLDFSKLAALYDFNYDRIEKNDQIADGIRRSMLTPGGAICEVIISPEQTIVPKASAFRRPDGTIESRPLEDMAPFLPREEVWKNMHLFD